MISTLFQSQSAPEISPADPITPVTSVFWRTAVTHRPAGITDSITMHSQATSILNPTPSLLCNHFSVSDVVCEMSQEDSEASSILGTVFGTVFSSLILITATVITIILFSILLWSQNRKKRLKLMDNVAYHSHDTKTQTDVMKTVNIETTMNEAYAAVSVPTSANLAYQSVVSPRESVDFATVVVKNMAHVENDVPISVNPAYLCTQNSNGNSQVCDHTQCSHVPANKLEYDYPRQQ